MENSVKGRRLGEFSYLVERCKIREMALAIGDPNPLYVDPDAARAKVTQKLEEDKRMLCEAEAKDQRGEVKIRATFEATLP